MRYRPSDDQLAAEARRERSRALASIPSPGVAWRGRRMRYDTDEQAAVQAGQRSVDALLGKANERIASVAELEALAALDPGSEYERHRANWIRTGSQIELALMLEWVRDA